MLFRCLFLLFVVSVLSQGVVTQDGDPCSRMPCQPNEICIRKTATKFFCAQPGQVKQITKEELLREQQQPQNDDDLEILKGVVAGQADTTTVETVQNSDDLILQNLLNNAIESTTTTPPPIRKPQRRPGRPGRPVQQPVVQQFDGSEVDEIVKNVVNNPPTPGLQVPTNRLPKPNTTPMPIQPVETDDSQILQGLLNQPASVPNAPVEPVQQPEDGTILQNLFKNQHPIVPETPKINRLPAELRRPVQQTQQVDTGNDHEILTGLLNPTGAVDTQAVPSATETNGFDDNANEFEPEPTKQVEVQPADDDHQILKGLMNPTSTLTDEHDMSIIQGVMSDPMATTTTSTTTTTTTTVANEVPRVKTVQRLINGVRGRLLDIAETREQQINNQIATVEHDMQILENLLNKPVSRRGRIQLVNPVRPTPAPKSPEDTQILQSLLDSQPVVNQPQSNDDDLQILQNLLQQTTTTTTTMAPKVVVPAWKQGVQRRIQPGSVQNDIRMLQKLRERAQMQKSASENDLVLEPESLPQVGPFEAPIDVLPNTEVDEIPQEPVEESTTTTTTMRPSILRDKLRGRSGIAAATQVKQPMSHILIDNLVKDAVENLTATTTTTTTTTTTPFKKELWCVGYEHGDQIPHPSDAKKFLVCQLNNDYVVMSCPATLVFNQYLNRCDRTQNEPPKACLSSPCKNGGTCVDTATYGFECKCEEGFAGTTCEKGSDPCYSNPCSPNGACNSLENFKIRSIKYYCLCNGGNSYGLRCDDNNSTFVNPCLKYHTESYYASELSPSIFIHCESDIMNLKSCHEPLVWSQKLFTCVSKDELESQNQEQQQQQQTDDQEETFEFVDEEHHDEEHPQQGSV